MLSSSILTRTTHYELMRYLGCQFPTLTSFYQIWHGNTNTPNACDSRDWKTRTENSLLFDNYKLYPWGVDSNPFQTLYWWKHYIDFAIFSSRFLLTKIISSQWNKFHIENKGSYVLTKEYRFQAESDQVDAEKFTVWKLVTRNTSNMIIRHNEASD